MQIQEEALKLIQRHFQKDGLVSSMMYNVEDEFIGAEARSRSERNSIKSSIQHWNYRKSVTLFILQSGVTQTIPPEEDLINSDRLGDSGRSSGLASHGQTSIIH